MGYSKNYYFAANLAACFAAATALSLGSYSSGWRVTNLKELINLFDYSLSPSVVDYAPFNFTNSINLTSSTSYPISPSTNVMYSFVNSGQIFAQDKANGTWFVACRTFTVTGTVLT